LKKILFTLILLPLLGISQSCVCFRGDYLNDYKESSFIAHVKISEFSENKGGKNIDNTTFEIIESFRGPAINNLNIAQSTGNGKDNASCRLYLRPGDELILYAKSSGELGMYTSPCMRNTFVRKDDSKFEKETDAELYKLRNMVAFQETIDGGNTYCHSLALDGETRGLIEDIELERTDAYFGIYKIKFDVFNRINRIDVVSPFTTNIDKKIRILLIKKNWATCNLTESKELLVGYFYYPATSNREAKLTSL
jgi:hypothetical protein